ncbi:carbon-nitrogen family hydrolase [Staphylococcus aureus]|uniref:carbon-nitrogen family hydrolase n=1 Tax=Staphylococcus aureus TaxID=1280 RepID=UPI000C79DB3A|nr:carbon-nitrogen family hydrolase [Staphylococcus aureus]AUJ55593.1 carbon-nitrogen hydrolase [Staphylococcus aureus]AUJ58226.1 carbon-nitrogen hydrolase [Staphylococcus aureus]AUW99736.1 carbon-nitrogen hydrolase [Staphylococcus aureus]MBU6083679.1 carbon-nitrogen family hydrolase [Staphylococcus aureus]MBU6086664.1 carbon-nitrogen family hydrolase [Staphylococcus aureus]
MKVQIYQLPIIFGDSSKNEAQITQWFEKNMNAEVDVVVLPEMWNNGYDLEHLNEKADNNLGQSFSFIKHLAEKYKVDIVAGSVSNIRNNQIFNTAFSVNKSGQLINEYDKVHLVPMLREHEFLTAGENVAEPFQLSDGTYVTQLICYDLRFPELLRYPARSGAKIAFYVAQWPMSRLQHWHSLLKARAIENNMFVIGTNSTGFDGNTEYAGHSIVINPNGDLVGELNESSDILTVDLNLNEVEQQRENIPVFKSIKLDLYK